jgi:hypothetical protein
MFGSLLALVLVSLVALPAAATDKDGDGLSDGFEKKWGLTDPNKRDTDGDGVVDTVEDHDGDRLGNLGEQRFGTDPGNRDSDGDGKSDGNEDKDRDGRSNAREQDQRPIPRDMRPPLARAKYDHPADKARCVEPNTGSRARRCVLGNLRGDTRVVLMGDSHATMWLPAFKRSAAKEGWRLITLIRGGCQPALGTRNIGQHLIDRGKSCQAWRQNAIKWLNTHPPDLIVITSSDTYKLVTTTGKTIPKRKRPELWRKGMKRLIAAMPGASDVMLFGEGPQNRANPVKCLWRNGSNMSACTSPWEPPRKRLVERALREAAAAKGAQFRTLYDSLCTYRPCPLVHDDVLLWRDQGHLTATISKRLTPSVRMILRDALDRGSAANPSVPPLEGSTDGVSRWT